MSHFHTPSFGDEEFELTAIPTLDPSNFPLDIEPLIPCESTSNFNTLNIQDNDIINSTEDNYSKIQVKLEPKYRPELIEPRKPVSAYAAFFRDTQNAIKGQNPSASFDEISKIVASMWQALDQNRKELYNRNAEIEKRDYLQKLNEYKMNLGGSNQLKDISSPHILQPKQQHFPMPMIDVNDMKDIKDIKDIPIASKPAVFCVNNTTDISSSTDVKNFNLSTLGNPQFTDNIMDQQQNSMEDSDNIGLQSVLPNLLEDTATVNKCIREDCTNAAIINPDWEDEYCSNECVVTHCRNVFSKWMQNRRNPKTVAPT